MIELLPRAVQHPRIWSEVELAISGTTMVVVIASDGEAVTGLRFGPGADHAAWLAGSDGPATTSRSGLLATAADQLRSYAAGELTGFDVPLRLHGTPFQAAVWSALTQVPYGRTVSYGELAAEVGRPSGARAVGAAVGANPVGIMVPCHRVIGAGGTLTGFAGGLDNKVALLIREGVLAA